MEISVEGNDEMLYDFPRFMQYIYWKIMLFHGWIKQMKGNMNGLLLLRALIFMYYNVYDL